MTHFLGLSKDLLLLFVTVSGDDDDMKSGYWMYGEVTDCAEVVTLSKLETSSFHCEELPPCYPQILPSTQKQSFYVTSVRWEAVISRPGFQRKQLYCKKCLPFRWSSFDRCSVYSKPKVTFMHNFNHIQHNAKQLTSPHNSRTHFS